MQAQPLVDTIQMVSIMPSHLTRPHPVWGTRKEALTKKLG